MILKELQAGSEPLLLLHGGAGAIRADILSEDLRLRRLEGLRCALRAGWSLLAKGASALDAVQGTVEALEDYPLFNAGRGSVLNCNGVVEMDACIMDGQKLAVGSLCGSRRLRNPVSGARRLLESGRVFAVGRDVEAWLASQGECLKEKEWFLTPDRVAQFQAVKGETGTLLDHEAEARLQLEKGTVGAVARDSSAGLAAATSTGGMSNKPPGRIGDSPVPGAGTWADSRSLALSATGDGEAILRCALAHEVEAQLRLADCSLADAGRKGLERLADLEGSGGLVAIDQNGTGLLAANSEGMYRGWVDPVKGRYGLAMFQEEIMEEGSITDLLQKVPA